MKSVKYLWLSLLIVIIDQLSKWWIRAYFAKNPLLDSIPVWGDFFRITFVENTGAAFSMTLGSPLINRIIFVVVALVAIGVLFWLLKQSNSRLSSLGYSLVIGGATGNLIDRILRGKVTDFFDNDFPDFIMHRWPVYNIADSAIFVAMLLLAVYFLFYDKPTKLDKQS